MTGLGVVAVGDSIINGQTYRQVVHPQSWAQWLAEAGDWPFTRYSRGGAASADVVSEQLPRLNRTGYDVAAVTVGANDLLYGWDADEFAANVGAILSRLCEVADRVVLTNLPLTFRRLPGADRKINAAVPAANELLSKAAAEHDAVLIDVSDMARAAWLHPDKVHPTALGLREIGRRAGVALGLPDPGGPVVGTIGFGQRTRHGARSAGQVVRVSAKRLLGRRA